VALLEFTVGCGVRIRLQLLVSPVRLSGDWTEVCLLSSAESLLCEALSEFCCSCRVRIRLQLLVSPVRLTFDDLLVCWTGAHADSSYCVERQLCMYTGIRNTSVFGTAAARGALGELVYGF
jgi:hypothetical protein